MLEMMLKALEFGVLGLCAVTLILVWRIVKTEQDRDGAPRKGILKTSYVFMFFSFSLAVLNGYVQLNQSTAQERTSIDSNVAEVRLREAEDKLLAIRSAAQPILTARSNIIKNLPNGPERDTLEILVNSLREVLNE